MSENQERVNFYEEMERKARRTLKLTDRVYFNGKEIFYEEYGAGAKIVNKDGIVIADFPNHVLAENFMEMCFLVKEYMTVYEDEYGIPHMKYNTN